MKSIKFNQKLTTLVLLLLTGIGIFSILHEEFAIKSNESLEENLPVWIDMMEEPGVNLSEAKKTFDDYWQYNKHFKGDRSKQFERWYAKNLKRLDEFGNVISATQVNKEFQKMRSMALVSQQGNWTNYGPINVGKKTNGDPRNGGRVKDIAFHPTDANTYLVSCFKSGLFKTTDAGLSWAPLTDHLPEEVYISKFHASSPNTIFIGTNSGILKSTDGGTSWNTTGLSTNKTNALLIKTDNQNIIVAGNESGIYRSTNGGATFTLVKTASKVEELRIHPTNANIMYASTNGSTSQFFRSTDGGVTWTENTTAFGQGAFMKIAVTPNQPNYVYVINSRDHLGQDSFEGVYRSTDSGVTFTKRSGGTPCITGYKIDGTISRGQPNYNLFIVADPTNANILYAGGVKSWKSTNGGTTWAQSFDNVTDLGFGLHLDQLTWAYSPINDKLFALNDGGIWFLNGSNKFQGITDGLPIAEVWECTQSQTTKSNVAGGTFHAGIKLNLNGTWYSNWGGDESTVLFDYSDDTYAYHFKYDKIHRSIDGGLTFQRINSTSADRGEYTGTGVLDKSSVNTLFVGLFEVERSQNVRTANRLDVTWTKISSFGGNTKIQKIEQCDANHNIMYVSRAGSFYRSDNVRATSPSFTNISTSLPGSGTVTDIATHPTNDNLVYILQGSKVYKSSNKGSSWTDISNGLPSVALLEMVYDKSSNEGIYIGTDIGVYYKDVTLTNWIDYGNGLPVIRVSGMDIYYGATRSQSVLTIATDGRGFWRSDLYSVASQSLEAEYPLDTNVQDTSGNGYNGTNGGVSFINDSERGQVANFDGTDEVIVNGYSGIQQGSDRTITAWVKTTTTNDAIVSWGTTATSTKWIFLVDGSGRIRTEVAGGFIVGSTAINDGQWHHVAFVLADDGTPTINEGVIYIDGQSDTISSSNTTDVNTGNGTVKIGTDHASRRFLGQMDELHIIDEAWSANDILVGYNSSLPPTANFTANQTTIIEGNSVSFTDTSTGNVTSWSWSFTGGTPSTSTSQNPTITYNAVGTYQVQLTATNNNGSNTETKSAYITVNDMTLEAEYPLDNNVQDTSGNGYNGTNSGVAFINDSERGQVADFDGTDEVVVNGYNGIEGGDDRTIIAWIKTTTTNDAIASWGTTATSAKWIFLVDGSGRIRAEVAGGSIVGTTTINDGQWHHVACTFSNDGTPNINELKIYIDGQLDTISSSSSRTINTGNGTVKIGTDHASRRFLGQIDDLHIIDEAWSASQILSDYNGSTSKSSKKKENTRLAFEGENHSIPDHVAFPIPFSDRLTIKMLSTDVSKITIYNVHGSLVKIVYPKSKTEKTIIETKNMMPGLYFVKIDSNVGCSTLKVIKE
ncbi:LamG-like jellyroll fold domain-containing protein [Flavivirga spongiicola]|uniref:PKD domain-containing protein n=1 Tax=Flavivirga spongiicola TaxID=421621 RepID=A0ABU7XXR0_9FLAO|nr:LamG-like jellyroll fold domain-containing protein [Flavivirga sp. MEBiC05379]MDO5979741.1 LamG-like jellyroll fold domain-containing protein [Flavivirga sp. MEBiC05379]